MEGIDKLAKIIEFIKKKNKKSAQIEYQKYSKMPKDKAKQYVESLEKKFLKGDVDVGNISDEELRMFNQKPTKEDIVKSKKEKIRKIIISIAVFIGSFILFFVVVDNDRNAAPDKRDAWVIASKFVQGEMKSPTTAEFPRYDKSFVKDLGDCTFEVNGYVDGQNSFGATIRNNFNVTVKNPSCIWTENWQLIYINMY